MKNKQTKQRTQCLCCGMFLETKCNILYKAYIFACTVMPFLHHFIVYSTWSIHSAIFNILLFPFRLDFEKILFSCLHLKPDTAVRAITLQLCHLISATICVCLSWIGAERKRGAHFTASCLLRGSSHSWFSSLRISKHLLERTRQPLWSVRIKAVSTFYYIRTARAGLAWGARGWEGGEESERCSPRPASASCFHFFLERARSHAGCRERWSGFGHFWRGFTKFTDKRLDTWPYFISVSDQTWICNKNLISLLL